MDDEQSWALLVKHIEAKFSGIKLTPTNVRLGYLKRLFDDLPANQLLDLLPQRIQSHIKLRPQYLACDKLNHWETSLIVLCYEHLTVPNRNQLKQELQQAIGLENYGALRQGASVLLRNSFEVEISVIAGLLSGIVQYHLKLGLPIQDSQKMQRSFERCNLKFLSTHPTLQMQSLKDNLKLDNSNPEHLAYWDRQTNKGLLHLGGAPVLFSKRNYRVPGRVRKMMNAMADHEGSYSSLLDTLELIRHKEDRLESFHSKYRSCATRLLYGCKSLELVDLELAERPTTDDEASVNHLTEKACLPRADKVPVPKAAAILPVPIEGGELPDDDVKDKSSPSLKV